MKLKRLVSAIVAVGMMVAMLPVSAVTAFADSDPVKGLEIVTDGVRGYPKVPEAVGTINVDGVTLERKLYSKNTNPYLDKVFGEGWECQIRQGSLIADNMTIKAGYTYAGSSNAITITFNNSGTVTGGTYAYFSNSGTVTDCYAQTLVNGKSGTINGGTFNRLNTNNGTINRAVFKESTKLTDQHVITANGCTINGKISNKAYTLGDPKVTISFKDTRKKVNGWLINGEKVDETTLPGAVAGRDGDYATLTFTMPADKDLEITVNKVVTPLKIENGLPVDELGQYSGSPYDGWTYNSGAETEELNKAMTIEDWYTANLEKNEVRWRITNNGTLQNGTIKNNVTNNGTVKDITAMAYFYNYGTIESGVFSRQADFGEQNPSVRWVTVNGGTVNGMTTAGVVGEQEVTITAPDGFKCWSVAGDTDFTLTEEQKHTNPLTLKLNGEDKGTIILTAQSEEGYYPLNLTDGKAYSATTDGAKEKEITAARAGDTVILEADATLIPDGMIFDRWEITGDTELTGGFDANAEKTQFTMPNGSVTIRAMYRMADVEEPNVLGTAAVIGTVAVGSAVIAWQGYNIAADLYAQSILPEGTAIPETKEALAVMLWQNAGKPEVVAADGTALTETEQAQQWVVANGLMENEEDGTFHPEKGVGKFAALNTIKAQTEKANAQ